MGRTSAKDVLQTPEQVREAAEKLLQGGAGGTVTTGAGGSGGVLLCGEVRAVDGGHGQSQHPSPRLTTYPAGEGWGEKSGPSLMSPAGREGERDIRALPATLCGGTGASWAEA